MDTKTESPGGVPVQRMVGALRDLFKNPMPHDLIAIRREVATEYGGDDEAAKQAMDAWCSQEYMEHKVEAHRTAWHNAADVLRECGPNDKTLPTEGAAQDS